MWDPVPSPSSERKALLRHRGGGGGGAHQSAQHGHGDRDGGDRPPRGPLHRTDEPDRAAGVRPPAISPRGRAASHASGAPLPDDARPSPPPSRLSRSVDSMDSPSSRFDSPSTRSLSNLPAGPRRPGRDGPRARRMDRGHSGGDAALAPRPALTHGYGGSEHDFLDRLSLGDETASSGTSGASRGPRRRGWSAGSSDGPPPPVEITATFPPFGLATVEGSPRSARDDDDGGARRGPLPHAPPVRGGGGAPFFVLGFDLTRRGRRSQFLISAGAAFGFSLMYGYLQELLSVGLCHRKLGLFLACAQFAGYTVLSFFFRRLDGGNYGGGDGAASAGASLPGGLKRTMRWGRPGVAGAAGGHGRRGPVPTELYVGLSILRAIDLGMTNLAMQFLNYPAKTLMKSTRVMFTMLFGVVVAKKRYGIADYSIVALMVLGLVLFMHADSHSSAVFQPVGIAMLTVSLLCDGAISNMSEQIMNKYNVGQDEFIYRLYGTALVFITLAAGARGDLRDGLTFLSGPGTLQEMEEGSDPTWSVPGKLLAMALFSATGFLASSCSAAITKSFGALAMSITSTARKAATIFLSFALFKNECTVEHVLGIVLFVASLVAKSLRASRRGHRHHHHHVPHQYGEKRRAHQGDDAV